MSKKIILTFSLIFFMFICCLPTKAYTKNDAEIQIDSSKRIIDVESISYSTKINFSEKQTHHFYYEGVDKDVYYIVFLKEKRISLIMSENMERTEFSLKILIFDENRDELLSTGFQKINKSYFDILAKDSIKEPFNSEIEENLMSDTYLFGKKHKYDSEEEITTFELERNERSIEKMTETDSYLDSYNPVYAPFDKGPYPKRYHDNIINLIPEKWFYAPGQSHCYLGKEYGVYTTTYEDFHDIVYSDCYITEVTIWDFETSLPGLCEDPNSADDFGTKRMLSLSIKPIITGVYYSFKRKNVGELYWNKYFEVTESQIVVKANEKEDHQFSYSPVYLAPDEMNFAIGNEEDYRCPEGHTAAEFEKFTYELNVSTQNTSSLNKTLKMTGYAFETVTTFVGAVSKDPEVKVATAILKCLYKVYEKLCNRKEKVIQDRKIESIGSIAKGIEISYTGNPGGNSYKELIIHKFESSFGDVFSNSMLDSYEHVITLDVNLDGHCNNNTDYFSLIDSGVYRLYDSKGNVLSVNNEASFSRDVIYDSLIQDNCPTVTKISTGNSKFNVNLSSKGASSIFPIRTDEDGLYQFENSNPNMKIEIYDAKGNYVAQTNYYDFANSCCAYLEANKNYIVRSIMYKTTDFGQGTISVSELPYAYPVKGNKRIQINGSQSNVTYIPMRVYIGRYTFSTQSGSDTTIRIFDEYGKLLSESFDPLADLSEDVPDLDAYISFGVNNENRYSYDEMYYIIIILEVSMIDKFDYDLIVNYYDI